MNYKRFVSSYIFKPQLAGYTGVEVEAFLVRNNYIVPEAVHYLNTGKQLGLNGWKPELPAVQVELNTPPCASIDELGRSIHVGVLNGRQIAQAAQLTLLFVGAAPCEVPLHIYPTQRYQEIAARTPIERMRAGFRVAGTHIHKGAHDWNHALWMYNKLIRHLNVLIDVGDLSKNRARVNLYTQMVPNWNPPMYRSTRDVYNCAVTQGFISDLGSCWHWIRITPKGTVEVRCFDSTDDTAQICRWSQLIDQLINS